ncbi:hypothetical protein HWV62_16702 [Athelia sp. TMB]|nr:hypothetical protein HWV62_16702 [Athelia sp. TMB]
MSNENNWVFPPYTGAPQTLARPYQTYAAPVTPFDYPHAPPIPPYQQRQPLQTAQTPYTDPLQQTLPAPPFIPGDTALQCRRLDMFQPGTQHVVFDRTGQCVADPSDAEHIATTGKGARAECDTATKGRKGNGKKGRKNGDGESERKVGDGKKKKKKKERGSKSGEVNHCTPGKSDEEIKELDEKDSKAAVVTPTANAWDDTERLKMVKHICSEEVWPNFKVKQGSSDGDDATKDNDEDEDERERAYGKKCKQAKKARYTKNVLDLFESSSFFVIIDTVAHDNLDVVRSRTFNSAMPVSDDEDAKGEKLAMELAKEEGIEV